MTRFPTFLLCLATVVVITTRPATADDPEENVDRLKASEIIVEGVEEALSDVPEEVRERVLEVLRSRNITVEDAHNEDEEDAHEEDESDEDRAPFPSVVLTQSMGRMLTVGPDGKAKWRDFPDQDSKLDVVDVPEDVWEQFRAIQERMQALRDSRNQEVIHLDWDSDAHIIVVGPDGVEQELHFTDEDDDLDVYLENHEDIPESVRDLLRQTRTRFDHGMRFGHDDEDHDDEDHDDEDWEEDEFDELGELHDKLDEILDRITDLETKIDRLSK